jgi:hypothetical protein
MNAAATESVTKTNPSQDFVIKEVLRQLGTPRALYRVTAMNLWKNHYRVNVYCQTHTGEAALQPVIMTDSFFVDVVDDQIVAQPPIQQRYRTEPVFRTNAV